MVKHIQYQSKFQVWAHSVIQFNGHLLRPDAIMALEDQPVEYVAEDEGGFEGSNWGSWEGPAVCRGVCPGRGAK